MKNSSDTIGKQNRDLQACSTLPPPTVPLRAPKFEGNHLYIRREIFLLVGLRKSTALNGVTFHNTVCFSNCIQ
jgi:hypothetical protein